MQLHTQLNPVEKGGLTSEGSFQIKASAKAFSILSSSLYQDKIAAVVRELSCNAYDSHVAAGHPEKPFKISLPSFLSKKFSIRDYGVGLSQDQVMRLYTTYFESTKDDSNDFIGALGLGSKSPFSYVTSFGVVSYYGGEAKTYSAFIGEDGTPRIALMSTSPTEEPNGLEVSLAIKSGDASAFQRAVVDQLAYFKVKPEVRPAVQWTTHEIAVQGTGWHQPKGQSGSQMPSYVLTGQIRYPIKKELFSSDEQALLGVGIILEMNLGEVDIAPSREALSYDPVTTKNIRDRLAVVTKELQKKINDQITGAKTLWEASHQMGELFGYNSPYYYHQHLKKGLLWNGRLIPETFNLHVKSTTVKWVSKSAYDMKYQNPRHDWRDYDRTVGGGHKFFVNDVPNWWVRLKYYHAEVEECDNAIVLQGDIGEIKKIIEGIGSPDYTLLSSVVIPAGTGPTTARTPVAKVKKLNGRNVVDTNLDLSVPGHFIHYHQFNILRGPDAKDFTNRTKLEPYNIYLLKAGLIELGLMKDEEIYFIPGTYFDRLKRRPNLVEFLTDARKWVEDYLDKHGLREAFAKYDAFQRWNGLAKLEFLAKHKELLPLLKDFPLSKPKDYDKVAAILRNMEITLDTSFDPAKAYEALPEELRDFEDFARYHSYDSGSRNSHPTYQFLVTSIATKNGV